MFQGFEPIYDKYSKLLILGSFPSVKSREVGFYYGHPQNRFWKMLATCFDEPMPKTIEEKIQFLKRHQIALWDVVQESDLSGSADNTLEKSSKTIADFDKILKESQIKKILCNGKTAYNIFISSYKTEIPCLCMPSTSPANPRYNYDTWAKELKL